ncbi:hypothetical protein SDC9_110888 [bioreactor metagenome]|uniref:Uncharacterized protein n=1 Tax=bioreactor metagenome TaxID=1076179 RepID=A0A645BL95_9ZZZZ
MVAPEEAAGRTDGPHSRLFQFLAGSEHGIADIDTLATEQLRDVETAHGLEPYRKGERTGIDDIAGHHRVPDILDIDDADRESGNDLRGCHSHRADRGAGREIAIWRGGHHACAPKRAGANAR